MRTPGGGGAQKRQENNRITYCKKQQQSSLFTKPYLASRWFYYDVQKASELLVLAAGIMFHATLGGSLQRSPDP